MNRPVLDDAIDRANINLWVSREAMDRLFYEAYRQSQEAGYRVPQRKVLDDWLMKLPPVPEGFSANGAGPKPAGIKKKPARAHARRRKAGAA